MLGDYPQLSRLWGKKGMAPKSISPPQNQREAAELEDMTTRGEREVLLEVTLRSCIMSGYGMTGAVILKKAIQQGGWNFIDYPSVFPEEYRSEDLRLREESEATNGLPGLWGVRGYAVVSPPVRTLSKCLPEDIIYDMGVAVVDSMAEGKGVGQVIHGLTLLEKLFGAERTRVFPSSGSGLLSRVIALWEEGVDYAPDHLTTGELLLYVIQRWTDVEEKGMGEYPPGQTSSELNLWYQVLQGYADLENFLGARRVWNKMQERLKVLMPENDLPFVSKPNTQERVAEVDERWSTHFFHPPAVLASYLNVLNKNRRSRIATSLLSPQDHAPFPVIPPQYYHLPPLTPPLLAMAHLTNDPKLGHDIVSLLPLNIPGAVPHTTLTSMENMYLRLGDFVSAQGVIDHMKKIGICLDGVDIGVIIENALRRDKEEGYAFVESIVKNEEQSKNKHNIPADQKIPSAWGSWRLPYSAAAGPAKKNVFVKFEGYLMSKLPAPKQHPPAPTMSPSGWISALNHAIEAGDRERAEWALNGLGVDIRKRQALSTKVFNILLKGVVMRDGARKAWEMLRAHCLPDERFRRNRGTWIRKVGKGREWEWVSVGKDKEGVRPDLVTFRTVLDEAVREGMRLGREERGEWFRFKVNKGWGSVDGNLRRGTKKKEVKVKSGGDLLGMLMLDFGDKKEIMVVDELADWQAKMKRRQMQRREMGEIIRACRENLGKMSGL